ncbi:hypothetical protein [Scytonema sp. HK-05]|nr:hypothetical protein [Scytonema sp. HK-05]
MSTMISGRKCRYLKRVETAISVENNSLRMAQNSTTMFFKLSEVLS